MKEILNKILSFILSPITFNIDSFEDQGSSRITEITSSIYLGPRPDETAITELQETGITHIVSCLNKEDYRSVNFLERSFKHLFLGINDGIYEDITASFLQYFSFTESLKHYHPNSKLFVHCEAGVSRSAAFVIALLMKLETRRFFDVYKSVKSKRTQVLPNIGFASQLQQLEDTLKITDKTEKPSSLAQYLYHVCNFPADIEIIQSALEQNNFNAVEAAKSIFGGEIPRVIQGVRL